MNESFKKAFISQRVIKGVKKLIKQHTGEDVNIKSRYLARLSVHQMHEDSAPLTSCLFLNQFKDFTVKHLNGLTTFIHFI